MNSVTLLTHAPAPRLVAGELTMTLEPDGGLRDVVLGERLAISRIHPTARAADWSTVPLELGQIDGEVSDTSFHLRIPVALSGPLALSGVLTLAGRDNTLDVAFDAKAVEQFSYCRIGLCVLHPAAACVGRPYRAGDGSLTTHGTLPRQVAPQPAAGVGYAPLVGPFSTLELDQLGTAVRLEFAGDRFELEDQRNWTDDSFKTYCTPLELGFPHRAQRGTRFACSVTARVRRRGRRVRPPGSATPGLRLGGRAGTIPSFGVPAPRPGERRHSGQRGHVTLDADVATLAAHLEHARRLGQTGVAVELRLRAHGPPRRSATAVARELAALDRAVARVLVWHADGVAAAAAFARSLRAALPRPAVPWVGLGTTGPFSELNRSAVSADGVDGMWFAMSAQVHASDDRSLFETIAGQYAAATSARRRCGASIAIGGVTLRPDGGQDERAGTPLAAAWTLASAASLATARVSSVTYRDGAVRSAGSPERVVFDAISSLSGHPRLAAAVASGGVNLLAVAGRLPDRTVALVVNAGAQPALLELTGLDGHAVEPLVGGVETSGAPRPTVALGPYACVRIERR